MRLNRRNEQLVTRMREMRVSNVVLAENTSVDLVKLSKIRNGYAVPTPEEAQRIASVLECSAAELFTINQKGITNEA